MIYCFEREETAYGVRIGDWSSGVCSSDRACAPGRRRLENINAPYRGSARNDAEFERRRPAELAAIAAARSKQVASDGWRQAFRWPVTGRLSGFFGSQRVYQGKPGSYHSGTDVAVPAGTPFVSPPEEIGRAHV